MLDKTNSTTPDMGDVYDQFAKAFGEADKLPTWKYVGKAAMERILNPHLNSAAIVLDLGSASARVEAGVLIPGGANPANIVGIEISPDQVEMAKHRIPEATFQVGDISDPSLLSDRNGSFTLATSHMVFEHLDDTQLARTCANVYRLLKDGGVFAFVVTHPDKMTDLDGNMVTTYGEFTTTAPWGGVLHNWRRSVEDTKRIVAEAGFTVDSVEELPFPTQAPSGLSGEDLKIFNEHVAKYSRYPAIRLALSAHK